MTKATYSLLRLTVPELEESLLGTLRRHGSKQQAWSKEQEVRGLTSPDPSMKHRESKTQRD